MRDLGLAYEEAKKELQEVVVLDARMNEIYATFSHNSLEEKKARLADFEKLYQMRDSKSIIINNCQCLLQSIIESFSKCNLNWLERKNIERRIKDMKKQVENHIDFDMITQSYLDDITKEKEEALKQESESTEEEPPVKKSLFSRKK